MNHIFILLGGFVGPDGWATSAGMLGLAAQLRKAFPTAEVTVDTWNNYRAVGNKICEVKDGKVVVIGYSGGGSRAVMLAREFHTNAHIDLMVLYDPSPPWQMETLIGTRVDKCIQYYNTSPFFFGLGGGKTSGPQVQTISIAENHMLVQADQALHARTIAAIRGLQ